MLLRERIPTFSTSHHEVNNAYNDLILHFGARMKIPVLE
jgi:hypothetical protein